MTTPEEAFAKGALVHINTTVRPPVAVLNPAATVAFCKGEGVVEVRVGEHWSRTELRSHGVGEGFTFSIAQLILDAAKAQGVPVAEMSADARAARPLIGEGGPGVPAPWDHRSPQAIIADFLSDFAGGDAPAEKWEPNAATLMAWLRDEGYTITTE